MSSKRTSTRAISKAGTGVLVASQTDFRFLNPEQFGTILAIQPLYVLKNVDEEWKSRFELAI
jgi:hypothetical protein